jgi:tetratricopeptide (TPR) repeat protein
MTRKWLRAIIAQLPALLLLLGLLIFGLGIGLQYLLNRKIVMTLVGPDAAPFVPVALAGLCMAALTLLIWFAGIGFMLARQTRLHGADYGQAYKLVAAYQFDDAIPLLEYALESGKVTAEVLTLLARAYAYTGKYSRAHALIEQAVTLYPENPTPYQTLGLAFTLESDDEQTVAAWQAAVERDPTAINWAELGLALVFAHRDADALNALERASQEVLPAPHALRVYYHLTQLYAVSGNAPAAASSAAKMVSARDGLTAWGYELSAVQGTGYGQRLTHEIQAIARALKDADAARVAA